MFHLQQTQKPPGFKKENHVANNSLDEAEILQGR